MFDKKLEHYWDDIPIGKENATDYPALCRLWGRKERAVRDILHDLSHYDTGDDYILVRSARGKGFYRTDDVETIKLFRNECLNKGRSIFAPVKKINRVLQGNNNQYSLNNNLRLYRENAGFTQQDVVEKMKETDPVFDNSLLSKMENGFCLPTGLQKARLAEIYGCEVWELVQEDFI